MNLPIKLQSFLDDLEFLPDREEKIEYLLETGKRFKGVPDTIATRPYPKSHQVPACESEAYGWVIPNDDGSYQIYFAVENPQGISAKALSVILDEGLAGASKQEIQSVPDEIVNKIFGNSISMGKGEGLRGMIRLIKHMINSD